MIHDMERNIKLEIIKMFIPLIGIFWLLKRIIPNLYEITWFDTSDKAKILLVCLVIYQIICIYSWKIFYLMYFFSYSFEQAFTK